MRRGKIITVLGFLVAIIPALGVPQSGKDIALTVLGILVAFIGLTLRRPPRQPSLFNQDDMDPSHEKVTTRHQEFEDDDINKDDSEDEDALVEDVNDEHNESHQKENH